MAFDVAKAYNEKKKKKDEKESNSSSTPFDVAERYKKYKYYETLDTSSVNDDYINTFITDTNNFFSGAEDTYKSIGWGNASSVYDSTNSTWQELQKRKDLVGAWLYKNKSRLTEDSYKALNDTLNSIDSGATSLLEGLGSAKDFYSQFDSEDAYNSYI